MIKLDWQFAPEYKTWETKVKAWDHMGEGYYRFIIQKRPEY